MHDKGLLAATITLAITAMASGLSAQTMDTAITYQGLIKDAGELVNDRADLVFRLWDAETGGRMLVEDIVTDVRIADGLFTTRFDFGTTFLTGDPRWLEITVDLHNGGDATLSPRQAFTPTPYALYALSSGSDNASPWQFDGGDIFYDAGNVGVGVRAPRFPLHVAGDAGFDGNMLFDGSETFIIGHTTNTGMVIDPRTPNLQLHVDGARTVTIMDRSVGIRTTNPTSTLTVAGVIESTSGGVRFPDGTVQDTAASDGYWEPDGSDIYYDGGDVGIGKTNPSRALDVDGLVRIVGAGDNALLPALSIENTDPDGWGLISTVSSPFPTATFVNEGGGPLIYAFNGPSGTDVVFKVTNDGTTETNVLQINGGSDLSEQFDVRADRDVKPGQVVCIDPDHPGKLVISTKAYDRTVAGIVSGAGGVKPGMLMGQTGSVADGQYPVALSGRVYVYADASGGPIGPGDLLTTSEVSGHAMKVVDYQRSQGAILGKAMTRLQQGRGLVLVLVSLQ